MKPPIIYERRASKLIGGWLGVDSVNGSDVQHKPLPDGIVPPGHTTRIIERSYAQFKGDRLFVNRNSADGFLIRSVFVGARRAATANGTPLIAEPFAVDFDKLASLRFEINDRGGERPREFAIKIERSADDFRCGAPFDLPQLSPGMDLIFEVENISPLPLRFLAAFFGRVLW